MLAWDRRDASKTLVLTLGKVLLYEGEVVPEGASLQQSIEVWYDTSVLKIAQHPSFVHYQIPAGGVRKEILSSKWEPCQMGYSPLTHRAKIQPAVGPQEDLLTIVKRRKLQWYGHVSHS